MILEISGVLYALGQAYSFCKEGNEYIEVAKDAYEAIKSVKDYLEVKEGEPKLVDMCWVKKSGFEDKMKEMGYGLRWTAPDKVPSRELEGYELMLEIDKDKKVKRKLALKDQSILMGKRRSPPVCG